MTTYDRPELLEGKTIKINVGCGKLYVTLNTKKDERFSEYPLDEVWIQPSFDNKEALYCCKTFLISISRLLTFVIRRLEKEDRGSLIKQLHNHTCPNYNVTTARSCVDAIARVLLCYWDGHKFKLGRCYVCKIKEEKK